MQIAYVTETYPPELNGVSLTVERAVRFLRAHEHAVDLIRPLQPGEEPRCDDDEWRTLGCRIPMYPDLRFGIARMVSLRQRFQRSGTELVHLATPGPLAWSALAAARSLGLATTSDFRTNFHQYSRYYGLGLFAPLVLGLLRRFHNLTERTFVPTRSARRELAGQGFHELSVVGRGVDTARFSPSRRSAALRDAWGAGETAPVLLCVGRIAAEKNIELALRAFSVLRQARPDARMVVVGDGPIRGRLEATYPSVHFAGVQRGDALAAHYASADVFLFPSLSDTFGNVTLEALASGLVVLAYDTAAAAEHVHSGRSGQLIVPGDESSFIDAACRLAGCFERLAPMREAAVQAAQHAQWSEVLGRFESELMNAARRHPIAAARPAAVT